METFLQEQSSLIKQHMREIDLFAKQNIQYEKGGPFAARLVLLGKKPDHTTTLFHAMPITTNRVLETGIASHHAEADSLDGPAIANLKKQITLLIADRQTQPVIVLFSSAQPCMACLTKIEICARRLVEEGYIQDKNFILIYGASYQQTQEIGGFYDYAYAIDFFNYKKSGPSPFTLIFHTNDLLENTPEEVQAILNNNALIEAVLFHKGRVLGLGYDQRTAVDLFKTAECTALHDASRTLKKEGNLAPWNLQGACLYTMNPDIGPLSYTECQWAAVEKVVSLSSNNSIHAQPKGVDCSACDNGTLFQKMAEGYNTPWSAIRVVWDRGFENKGQKEWARQVDHICYNGRKIGPDVSQKEKGVFDNLFMATIL